MQVLQGHYQCLGSNNVDEAFDDCWKQEVESKARECSLLSQAYDDSVFDGQLQLEEIAKCVHRL